MNIVMLYFSGTGNTRLISRQIEENLVLGGCCVHLIEAEDVLSGKMDLLRILSEADLLGIGYPVYDLHEPEIITDLIERMPAGHSPSPVFQYSTMGLIKGDCHAIVSRRLRKKNYYEIAGRSFICPSNGVFMYEDPGHPRNKTVRFEKGIDKAVGYFCDTVLHSYRRFINSPFSITGMRNPVWEIARFFSERLYGDKYYRNLAVTDRCSGCGVCVNSCPRNILHISEGKVSINKSDGCMRCLRCVSLCPGGAITFTSAGLKKQYTAKVRDELYQKAVSSQGR